jgi:23S rRNA (adenine-N6)-dimethyltransferase
VSNAGVAPGGLVVDVGAGTGVLTRALLDAGAEVIALELDPTLATALRRRFATAPVRVLEQDARSWAWPGVAFSVVANLPFAGSGAILGSLLSDPRRPLRRADVIVQWELAEKHAAVWPSTMRGTYWRAWFELAIAARLSRSAFSPVPAVDAAVLSAVTRRTPFVAPNDHAQYRNLLRHAFRTNRPLRQALRDYVTPRELRRLAELHGFDAGARARDLDARQWAAVFAHARRRRRRGS